MKKSLLLIQRSTANTQPIARSLANARPARNPSQLIRGFSNYMRQTPYSGVDAGGMMNDDEFLPDLERKELEHQKKMESSISVQKKPDDMLKHNEDYGGVLYKYDLPVVNKPVQFRSQALMLREEDIPPTPVESLMG